MSDQTSKNRYDLVLGLEVHIHIKTSKKMFCGCSADIYDKEPNTITCPTCLGLPGALPVPNFEAVRKAQMLGLALNCSVNTHSRFDRKHYFYHDLPKGYQISQYRKPLCENGYLELDNKEKVMIRRVHIEEDTAKSTHTKGKTLIDFNKSGMPLAEIVTEPVFKSVEDAVKFCKKIQDIVRVAGISYANMEKGQMRLEVNISLRPEDAEDLKYKVEIKNINSFKFMEKSIKSEIKRQSEMLDSGAFPLQENRGWDESTKTTILQREKEEAHDYRYFPEPDIPQMDFTPDHIEDLRLSLPELPAEIKKRLMSEYRISEKNAIYLSTGIGIGLVEKFEKLAKSGLEAETVSNYLINKKEYRELSQEEFKARLETEAVEAPDISSITEVLKEQEKAVGDFRRGKITAIQFLVGQVMKRLGGRADPQIIQRIIMEELEK